MDAASRPGCAIGTGRTQLLALDGCGRGRTAAMLAVMEGRRQQAFLHVAQLVGDIVCHQAVGREAGIEAADALVVDAVELDGEV